MIGYIGVVSGGEYSASWSENVGFSLDKQRVQDFLDKLKANKQHVIECNKRLRIFYQEFSQNHPRPLIPVLNIQPITSHTLETILYNQTETQKYDIAREEWNALYCAAFDVWVQQFVDYPFAQLPRGSHGECVNDYNTYNIEEIPVL